MRKSRRKIDTPIICSDSRYLVCRKDAVHSRNHGAQLGSSYFPVIVNMGPGAHYGEDIVTKACDSLFPGYVGMHEYIVVPLDEARIVEFKKVPPKPVEPVVKVTVRRF